jgi:hypothetical protein
MTRTIRMFAVTILLIGVMGGLTGTASNASTNTAGASASNSDGARSQDVLIRWDIIDIDPQAGVLTAGGTAVSEDPTSHDTLTFTSSGQAEPAGHEANGGGTFVHRHADGSVVARGVYVVTGFVSFKPLAGSLTGTPLIDGIGEKDEAHSGILTVRISVYVGGKVVATARLAVHCALPGAPSSAFEGATVKVHNGPDFSKIVDDGPNVFHVSQE